ncbi:hypothetical protein VE02_09756 [Pseudogymnoascus sp. 03VT05]|nr:hypothetical protein VE02_09756 [Pseudogymnoascus sp. 03VT05]
MARARTDGPGQGITGGYADSQSIRTALATLFGISWYNAIELIFLIFNSFHQYKGLYFWSLLLSASIGIMPYSLGFFLKFFQFAESWLSVTLLTVGWYVMVTGQSLVLYSRLHLVLINQKILRLVLYMIIINAIVLHIPTTVLTYGSNYSSSTQAFIKGYNIMEKIQMTGFCIQEFIISGLYIRETIKVLNLNPGRRNRKISHQLLGINLFIIIMDLGLLAIEYASYYAIEVALKGVIYSIKLKLEFAVLGKLVHLVNSHGGSNGTSEFPDSVDAIRVTSNVRTVSLAPRTRLNPPWMQPDDVSIAMFEHSEQGWDQASGRPDTSGSLTGETDTRVSI